MRNCEEMKLKLNRENIIRFTYFIINFILFNLCIAVIISQSVNYFSYTTESRSAPYIPVRQRIPKVTFCFSYHSIIDEKLKHEAFFHTHNFDDMKRISNLNASQLFNLTPSAEQLFKSCRFRFNETGNMIEVQGKDCMKTLRVTKYLIKGYVCYMVTPVLNYRTYDVSLTSSLFKDRRILYEISITDLLNEGHKLIASIHLRDFPWADDYFSMERIPSNVNEYIVLGADFLEEKLLPLPYNTRCLEKFNYYICISDCLNSELVKYAPHKVHHFSAIFEPVNASFTNQVTIRKIKGFSIEKESQCVDKCWLGECDSVLGMTISSPSYFSKNKLTFAVEAMKFPVNLEKYYPKVTLWDFLFQIFTIFGIFFGASIVGSLNLIKSFKKYMIFSEVKKEFPQVKILEQMQTQLNVILNNKAELTTKLISNKIKIQGEIITNTEKSAISKTLFILSIFFKVLTFIWLGNEVWSVLSSYMEYKTIMVFEHAIWDFAEIPKFNLCFHLSDLFNVTKDPTVIFAEKINKMSQIQQVYSNYTLEEIYDRVYEPISILKGCRIREDQQSRLIEYTNSSYCISQFNIERYFLKGQICYKFDPVNNKVTNLQLYKSDEIMESKGVFYSLILNPFISKYYRIEVIVNTLFYPQYSNEFSGETFRESYNKLYLVGYGNQEFFYKKWPYDTNCYDVIFDQTCISKCIIKQTIELLGYLPYSELLVKNSYIKMKILGYLDLMNKSIAETWNQLEKLCTQKCDNLPCEKVVTSTIVSSHMSSKHELEFALHTHLYPNLISKAEAIKGLIETIYTIICFISFWIGFNFLSFNPILLCFNRERKRTEKFFNNKINVMTRTLLFIDLWTKFLMSNLNREYKKLNENLLLTSKEKFSITEKLVRILCTISCSYVIFQIVENYLQYPTIINTRMLIENDFNSHRISICLSMEEHGVTDIYNHSMRQLFQLTPNSSEIMSYCGYRGIHKQDYQDSMNLSNVFAERIFILESNVTRCYEKFDIIKFLMQNYFCFAFRYKFPPQTQRIQSYLNNPKHLFSIGVNLSLVTEKIIMTVSDTLPTVSSIWSPVVLTDRSKSHWYKVSYAKYIYKVLGSPYNVDGHHSSRLMACVRRCVSGNLVNYGQESPESLIKNPNDLFFAKFDSEIFSKAKEECIDRCSFGLKGEYNTYVTTVGGKRSTIIPNSLSFALTSTNNPIIVSEFYEMKSLFNLLLDIGSVFSIWFGLSIIDLNPFLPLIHKLSHEEVQSISRRVALFNCKCQQILTTFHTIDQIIKTPND